MTATTERTREQIEADIASKRRERELYVSPAGVARCHEQLDELLDEWESARAMGPQSAG